MDLPVNLFQTLHNRENPDHIEDYGPFKCSKSNAWLGHGYYFWDSHIQLGHWWGDTLYGNNYVICKASATIDKSCLDLHGNGGHRNEFQSVCQEIINAGISTKDNLLIPQVIEFLKRKGLFNYEAIRALGTNSIKGTLTDNYIIYRLRFVRTSVTYMDLQPPVQVCLIHKTALSLQNYRIVYPDEYVENYA
jgi:hypothetical protein